VGRLVPEKNVDFLAEVVVGFLARHPGGRFLLVGEGPSKERLLATFAGHGLSERVHLGGVLQGRELASAYNAMNVFAFASLTETQGMVLTEAMAAGVPVVALDAPGAREVVRDGVNGRLVPRPDAVDFREALRWVAELGPGERRRLAEGMDETVREFSMAGSAAKQLALYETLTGSRHAPREIDTSPWTSARKLIEKEWEILRNIARAAGEAVRSETDDRIS
jgi:glycosyltransferase involved in cell wall biosynthesis